MDRKQSGSLATVPPVVPHRMTCTEKATLRMGLGPAMSCHRCPLGAYGDFRSVHKKSVLRGRLAWVLTRPDDTGERFSVSLGLRKPSGRDRIRTGDLQVMSLASYYFSTRQIQSNESRDSVKRDSIAHLCSRAGHPLDRHLDTLNLP